MATVAFALASFAGLLLGWVGSLFNWIVVITIFQFGAYFGNSVGLLTAWGILRDLGNILLLFGFIFMGILMILDLESFSAGKSIARLIIVAILLNFSLFAAEAVIDVADVLSASIYNQAGNVGCTSPNAGDCASINGGIAVQVLTATGLSGIWQTPYGAQDTLTSIGTSAYHKMFTYIGMAFFMSVTMVVLLAATIMLVIRAVVLVFVMVLAPLGFAAMAIPPFAGLGKQWRDMLISQAFFAPAYLLLLLVSLKIMSAVTTSLTSNGNPATLVAALTDANTSFGTVFIVFALVIGFMIAALMTAKKIGAIGADFATSVATKTVRGSVLAPARIAGAPIYRNTVGRGAAAISKFQTRPGFTGAIARSLNVATAGGFQSTLTKVQDSKLLGTESYSERKKLIEHTKHDAHIADIKGDIRKGLKKTATADEKNAMMKAVQKLSADEAVAELNDMKHDDQAELAKVMNPDKFAKILENKDLKGDAKHTILDGRFAEQREDLAEYKRKVASGVAVTKTDFDKVKKSFDKLALKDYEIIAANEGTLLDDATDTINVNTNGYGTSVIKDTVADKLKDSSCA